MTTAQDTKKARTPDNVAYGAKKRRKRRFFVKNDLMLMIFLKNYENFGKKDEKMSNYQELQA